MNKQVLQNANVPELMEAYALLETKTSHKTMELSLREMIRKEPLMQLIEKHTAEDIREYLEEVMQEGEYYQNILTNFFVEFEAYRNIKKCHICGALDHADAREKLTEEEFDYLYNNDYTEELEKCTYCENLVCCHCSEEFNEGDQIGCDVCKNTWTLYDCTKCKIPADECPFNREYTTCYECPEYTDYTEEESKDD